MNHMLQVYSLQLNWLVVLSSKNYAPTLVDRGHSISCLLAHALLDCAAVTRDCLWFSLTPPSKGERYLLFKVQPDGYATTSSSSSSLLPILRPHKLPGAVHFLFHSFTKLVKLIPTDVYLYIFLLHLVEHHGYAELINELNLHFTVF